MKKEKIIKLIPNIFSVIFLGPIFLIVGTVAPKFKLLYNIIFLFAIGMFISIMYGLIKEKKPLNLMRCMYFFIFIPLALYISIKQESSNIFARYALVFLATIYLLHNIIRIFNPVYSTSSIFDGVPEHPVRRLIKLFF